MNGPLFYASTAARGDGGRFDLSTNSGHGTCYLAASPVGAYLEALGRFRTLTETVIRERRLTIVVPLRTLELADLTDRTVLGRYGITGDISVGRHYGPSQDLAARLFESGVDGMWYAARHDPQFIERSAALFGPVGDRTEDESNKRFEITTSTIPEDLVVDVGQDFGVWPLPTTLLPDDDTRLGDF